MTTSPSTAPLTSTGAAPKPRPKALYWSSTAGVSLADALTAAGLREGVGLLSSPAVFEVARLVDGQLWEFRPQRGASLVSLDPTGASAVFESRVFDRVAELRWLQIEDGNGVAVLISESAAVAGRLATSPDEVRTIQAVDCIDNRYLLWGRPLADRGDTPDGWAVLAEARIGLMAVPVDGTALAADSNVHLHAVEYVAVDDAGNCAVVEERLTHLAAASELATGGLPNTSTGERP